MSLPKPPKPDKSLIEAQKAQAQAEAERRKELKAQQLEATKRGQSPLGSRSLITGGSATGYGRNFF
jgi:hypothetical protein